MPDSVVAPSDGYPMPPPDRFWGLPISQLTRRRLDNFQANRRGYWSWWIFLALFFLTLPAEFIANEKPLIVRYGGAFYYPVSRTL